MNAKARTKHKAGLLAAIVLIGILTALLFTLLSFGLNHVALIKALILGAVISLVSGYFELFIFPEYLRRYNFLSSLIVKTAFYVLVITVPVLLLWIIHESMLNDDGILATVSGSDFRHFLLKGDFRIIFFFSITAGFLINLFAQISSLIGKNTFANYLTGKYHKPVEEDRTFMFLDLTSSTTIAEKLDPVTFHRFMNSFFYDIDGSIVASRGEIYQYAGDEVIISWKGRRAFESANCIACYFSILSEIERLRENYLEQFGIVPAFRAGVHTGRVVTGEIGDSRKDIVFHGDVLNTASRIQAKSKELGVNLLISNDVYERLGNAEGYEFEMLGEFMLKGKLQMVKLYSVSRKK